MFDQVKQKPERKVSTDKAKKKSWTRRSGNLQTFSSADINKMPERRHQSPPGRHVGKKVEQIKPHGTERERARSRTTAPSHDVSAPLSSFARNRYNTYVVRTYRPCPATGSPA